MLDTGYYKKGGGRVRLRRQPALLRGNVPPRAQLVAVCVHAMKDSKETKKKEGFERSRSKKFST